MALGGVVVLGGIYAAIAFGVVPLLKKKKADIVQIGAYQDDLAKANAKIGEARGAEDRNEEIKAALREFDETYILKAEYDNYLLGAQEYIEKAAQAVGVKLNPVQTVGTQPLAPAKSGRRQTLAAFVVSVAASCSYQQIIDLIDRICAENPYVSVSGLKIFSSPTDPENHGVNFKVHFPIWANSRTAASLVPAEVSEKTDSGKQGSGAKPE